MDQKPSSERLAESLERARRHWQADRREEHPLGETAAPRPTPPSFTIAISRQAGANAPLVARTVGARLNWPVYDHELLQLIANEMGLRTSLLESVDERRFSFLREALGAFVGARPVAASGYLQHLVDVLGSLAAHGDCVIVGRGAPQLLPPATTLRVRLVGPREDRVEDIRQRFGISRDDAAAWVDRTDRERTSFVRDHFSRDPEQPDLYDLVLNSSRLTPADCADLVVDALVRLRRRTPAGSR